MPRLYCPSLPRPPPLAHHPLPVFTKHGMQMKETKIEGQTERANKNFGIKISVTFQTEKKIQTHKQTETEAGEVGAREMGLEKTKVNK